jgi:gamma-glutamylcyclotransferase (GGCT)/AIG2-like uncharacterized protein YtfP
MNNCSPSLVVGMDSSRLTSALQQINEARRNPVGSLDRLSKLMGGFEVLLETVPQRQSRELEGSRALAELDTLLTSQGVKGGTESLRSFLEPIIDRLIEALLEFPERRLAAYGSLLPGQENHHQISRLVGEWIDGYVEGVLHLNRSSEEERFPKMVWDLSGNLEAVCVFHSAALPECWERIDAFEGRFSYRRNLVPVMTDQGTLVCNLFEFVESQVHLE